MPKPRMRFQPGDPDAAAPVIEALVEEYAAWQRARHPEVQLVNASDLDLLLQWKVHYSDGRLDEWTVGEVEEFMLEWCPRKLTVSPEQAAEIPEAVAEAFEFLGDQSLLSPKGAPASRLASHARAVAGRFTAEMANPANFGMAKSIFGGADLDFDLDEPLTQERLDAMVEQFNALPFEERQARTDGALGGPAEELPVIGPVLLPPDAAVHESAAAAPVLAAFAALAEYFRAPGRPLTAKGNIKLADAQALAEILGTETLEQQIGEHTFHRTSATQMPQLDHWQWWARQAGAIRVRSGRMVGVEAWLKRRAKDPVGEACKAFDVLLAFGPVSSYVLRGPWAIDRITDHMTGPLLGMLLQAREPVAFERFVDAVEAVRDATGDQGFFADHPEFRREDSAATVDRLLEMLERAGVIVQHDVAHEPVRRIERRVGGTVALTPFGVVAAVDHVRDSGVEVTTVGDPGDMTARDVARFATEQELDPLGWVDLVATWVALQPDRRDALHDVVEAMADDDGLMLTLALPMPASLEADLTAVMHRLRESHGPEDALGAVALTWLLDHDELDVAQVPADAFAAAAMTTLGIIAKNDPEAVPEAMGIDQPREGQLEFVMAASRLMPGNVEALLDAIGRHHPDKVVAKAARKELIRVRSRLAYQRSQQ